MSSPSGTGELGAATPAAGQSTAAPGAEERGSVSIDDSVLRRLVEYCANQVDGVMTVQRRIAGVGTGNRGATAKVRSSGASAEVTMDLALRYPSAVRETVNQVRRRVAGEVSEQLGYRIQRFDVTVSALVGDEPTEQSRVV